MCREWYSMFQTQVCRVWGGFQYRSICTPQRELPSDGRRLRDQLSGIFHFVNITFEKGRVMVIQYMLKDKLDISKDDKLGNMTTAALIKNMIDNVFYIINYCFSIICRL